ncbi:MAG: DUF3971 domain-containing protein, partial [Gammaproteobacteria bacterium]|nr:DUF3971 domain-containing protein [Gammaproteobacteria bacterium]
WVLNQRFLEIRHSDILWRDYTRDEDDWYFNDVNVRLHSSGDQHEIYGSASLPLEIAYRSNFAARLHGDPTRGDQWNADVYLATTGVRVGRWLQHQVVGGYNIHEGRADAHLWAHWEQGQFISTSGEFQGNNLTLSNAARSRARQIDSASGRIAIHRGGSGWRIAADQLHLVQAQENWPPMQLRLGIDDKDGKRELFGSINALRADHAAQIALLSDSWSSDNQKILAESQPQGLLLDNMFYFVTEGDQNDFLIQGRTQNLGFRPLARTPGAYGVTARYVMTPQRGRVDLDAQDATLAYPKVFSEPLSIQNITGSVMWRKNADELRVWSNTLNAHNADVSLFGHLALSFPENQNIPPKIELAARFSNAVAVRVGRYLPINTLSPNIVEWIRNALVGGAFPNGEILFYGPLNSFPYEKGDGRFELRAQIKDLILNYTQGWPLITGINGELIYNGKQLHVAAHGGNIFKNRLSDVSVDIPSFNAKQVWLQVRGHAEGSTSDKLRFLHESPLEQSFAKALQPFGSSGQSELDLALSIPLNGEATTLIKGGVQIHNNHITATEYDLDFARADGTLFFTEKSVTGRQLHTYMNDRIPLSLNVDTDNDLGYRAIRITGDTTITQGDLTELFTQFLNKGHWADYLVGGAPVKVGINIPIDKNTDKELTLKVSSTLNGMAV